MKYCLIGKTLSHSFSKKVHDMGGLEYSLVELDENQLESFVRERKFNGFNITIPYKKDIGKFLVADDDYAKKYKVFNTAKLDENGKYLGYNTDVGGIKYTLNRMNFDAKGKGVVILGAGGAGTVAKNALLELGAKYAVNVSRNGDINYDNFFQVQECYLANLLINATPIGTYPDIEEPKIDVSLMKNLEAVFDLTYNPFTTELIYASNRLNLKVSNGLPMLIEQALLSQDIWLNKTHTQEETEKLITDVLKATQNVVLSGMPSCGKTTIGKEVAKMLNRKFVDTDDYIQKLTGLAPKEIIIKKGEKFFRDIEQDALKNVCKESELVIALGGGSLLSENGVKYAKMNGFIFYIDRPLEMLSVKDRPISQKTGVKKLYESRKAIYERTATAIIKNDKSKDVKTVAKEIVSAYEIACSKRR